jgi:DNA-directed RNA polymerase specialized sigma24 family protein
MSEAESISRLLDALQAGDAASATAVYVHFQDRARAAARGRISPAVQGRVGVDDIVQEAMKSALSFVRQGGLRHNRREEFEAVLVTVVQWKAAAATRKVAAERELPPEAATVLVDRGPGPDEEAMRQESEDLARQAVWEVTQFLFQQPEAMKSKHLAVKGLVRVLGIVHGLDAGEIYALLGELFPDRRPPGKRTIQLAIEDGWEMLHKDFRLGQP